VAAEPPSCFGQSTAGHTQEALTLCQNVSPDILENIVKLQSFEQGVQRLYYVAWLLLFLVTAGFGVFKIQHDFHQGHLSPEEVVEIGFAVPAALIGPWIAMWLIRWVYRGFVPLK
jgi:hypothetical protein